MREESDEPCDRPPCSHLHAGSRLVRRLLLAQQYHVSLELDVLHACGAGSCFEVHSHSWVSWRLDLLNVASGLEIHLDIEADVALHTSWDVRYPRLV